MKGVMRIRGAHTMPLDTPTRERLVEHHKGARRMMVYCVSHTAQGRTYAVSQYFIKTPNRTALEAFLDRCESREHYLGETTSHMEITY